MNKREQVQKEATDTVIANKYKGIIEVAPRVGKILLTLNALNNVNSEIDVLVTAPKVEIFDSWRKDIIKWGLNSNINIEYVWSNSLKKNKKQYHLIIADEIHEYNIKVLGQLKLRQLQGTRVLGLTGTLDKDSEVTINKILNIAPIYTYTIDQAIEDKIIADYQIFCIGCELDDVNENVIAGSKENSFLQTEKQAYTYWNKRYNDAVLHMRYSSLKFLMGKRKEVIYNSKTKVNITKKLIEKYDRCLIFTGLQVIANQLGEIAFHSKSDKGNLIKFQEGVINKLAVVSMISMGITVENLKISIFNQLKSGENLAVQQAMRAMNKEEDKIATIYIVYLKNTQDEKWLKSALKGFNSKKISYYTINDL